MSLPPPDRLLRKIEELWYDLWAVSDDVKDLRDGQFPVGERLGKAVFGYSAANAAAQAAMNMDPGIEAVVCEPQGVVKPPIWTGEPTPYSFKVTRVSRMSTERNLDLDPNEGDQKLGERR